MFEGLVGILNCAGSELEDYRNGINNLKNLKVDALLPGHYLFTVKNGQAQIDKAISKFNGVFVPRSLGQNF